LQSRATDETGATQPTRAQLIARRGQNSLYHYNAIQSWRVAANGEVSNVHA
jgi:sulfane dehydrogenase subunit SoxC